MKIIRKIVENGLAARKSAAIKVRQPLNSVLVHSRVFSDELTQLIKDELNIKSVKYMPATEDLSVELDTNLTPELIEEGKIRELIREIQEARKNSKCPTRSKNKPNPSRLSTFRKVFRIYKKSNSGSFDKKR